MNPPAVALEESLQKTADICDGNGSRYRPWAELLKRAFGIDVETCQSEQSSQLGWLEEH